MTNCLLKHHHPVEFTTSGTAKHSSAGRSLTHQLDSTERGLVMNASQAPKGTFHEPGCACEFCTHQGARKHGGAGTPEYGAWKNMRGRCNNPEHATYPYYGARGIAVCDRWNDSFENFLADMGRRPGPGYSLERIDNDGPYSPENCRWATRREQYRNRRPNRFLTFNGKTQCLTDWAAEIGCSAETLRGRLKSGMSVEEALTRPVQQQWWWAK